MTNLSTMLEKIKQHPDFSEAGMVLCHNGVVRKTSRDGREVTGLRVKVDREKLKQIVSEKKQTLGIVDILVEINDSKDLEIGDDVMYLVVAGDVRENVISVLSDTLNLIKSEVTNKTEFFLK